MNEILGNELIQYGFAGFAFLLAGIIFYILKEWRRDAKEGRQELLQMRVKNIDIIEKNTAAFVGHREALNGLKDNIKENTEVLRSINNKRR